ncbi:MAG: hypothetical protein ACP5GU_01830 [Thermoprotei archaeon]|jgi:hypothetical protein
MSRAKKIVIVTADWEISSNYVKEAAKKASEKLNLPIEEKKEDWDYLVAHGSKDEFGGIEIPQLFIEFDDGTVVHVFNRVPLDENGKPDLEKAINMISEAVNRGGV